MFLKISQNSRENTCLQLFEQGDSDTGRFLLILQNFKEYLWATADIYESIVIRNR